MSARLLPGGPVAQAVFDDLAPRIKALVEAGHAPGLGTILVGDDSASAGYIRMKQEKGIELGLAAPPIHLTQDATRRPPQPPPAGRDAGRPCRRDPRVQRGHRSRRDARATPDAAADRLRSRL